MKGIFRKVINSKPIVILDQIIYRIKEDRVFGTGAQLTYFLILSIFPFIVVLLNIISYTPLVREDVLANLTWYMPLETQELIYGFVDEIVKTSSQELLSFALIAGIWTASSGLTPVIRAINIAYDYEEKRSYFKIKAMAILFTLALLVLLIFIFSTLVLGELIGNKLSSYFHRTGLFLKIWSTLKLAITPAYMILTFALLYKFSPCVEKRKSITLKNTLPGAIFSTLGWMITSTIFSYYVNNFGKYSITYGSLGGVIILLIWLYISSIIIVLGGEVNATLEYLKINGYKWSKEKSFLGKFIK